MFSPWRRIISYGGRGLEDRLKAVLDNLVSRAIGFVVRLFVLLAAIVTMVVICLLTIIEIIIWPLLPLAIPGCLIAGLLWA